MTITTTTVDWLLSSGLTVVSTRSSVLLGGGGGVGVVGVVGRGVGLETSIQKKLKMNKTLRKSK